MILKGYNEKLVFSWCAILGGAGAGGGPNSAHSWHAHAHGARPPPPQLPSLVWYILQEKQKQKEKQESISRNRRGSRQTGPCGEVGSKFLWTDRWTD